MDASTGASGETSGVEHGVGSTGQVNGKRSVGTNGHARGTSGMPGAPSARPQRKPVEVRMTSEGPRWDGEENPFIDEYRYEGLVAQVYDLWFPAGAEYEDAHFYREAIELGDGPALEVACGTGRLLVPLLQAGLDVEGSDISADMLAICKAKGEAAGVRPRLHAGPMQAMDLGKKFRTIIIPYCSFQLLLNRDDAMAALSRFHKHLEPGGKLYVSNYTPWEDLFAQKTWYVRRVAQRPDDGATVLMHEATSCNRVEQIQTDWIKYEIYLRGRLEETQMHCMKMRWYFPHEFEMMAKAAGFGSFAAYGDYTFEPLNDDHGAAVYCAVK
jgi:SAM-dependent methyltransferase